MNSPAMTKFKTRFDAKKSLGASFVEDKFLSFQDFVNLTKDERAQFSDVKIKQPRLGKNGFGGMMVRYKMPTYVVK